MSGNGDIFYDRTSILFTPDGRIPQLEYAEETTKRDTSCIGIRYKDGVLLMAKKKLPKESPDLAILDSIEKLYQIEEHIAMGYAGLPGDARQLIEYAREIAQRHKSKYGERISVERLVKEICAIKHFYTQNAGLRIFGVSLLIGGVDGDPHLYETKPHGTYVEYKAKVIGEDKNDQRVMRKLEEYRDGMTLREAKKLAFRCLRRDVRNGPEMIECVVIDRSGLKRLSENEIKKIETELRQI
jgi:proteasome alpha subunit